MALNLIAPGERGNKVYYARGSVGGRVWEKSLRTTELKVARRRLREVEEELKGALPPKRGKETFAAAAQAYVRFRRPSLNDEMRIEAVVAKLGKKPLREITVGTLHAIAHDLKPGTRGATKNREVLRPAATVLHYAADAGMCEWIKVKLFPEEQPTTRALDQQTAAKLIEAAPAGPKRLLLLWLFHQGMRITHTLNVTWDKIDMERGTVAHRERKGRRVHDYIFPLHAEVLEALAAVPEAVRQGRVFPWTHRGGVKWIGRLAGKLGIPFSPHVARHSRGTWLNEEGAGLRTIMEALGHASERSSLRYQHGNVEVVRAVGEKISLKPQAPKVGTAA